VYSGTYFFNFEMREEMVGKSKSAPANEMVFFETRYQSLGFESG